MRVIYEIDFPSLSPSMGDMDKFLSAFGAETISIMVSDPNDKIIDVLVGLDADYEERNGEVDKACLERIKGYILESGGRDALIGVQLCEIIEQILDRIE